MHVRITLQDFIFFTGHMRTNKKILALCMGNHELYMRRRRPDSIEVQQMKAAAAEERAVRDSERAALERERATREEVDKQRAELERQVREFEDRERKAKEEVLPFFPIDSSVFPSLPSLPNLCFGLND